MNKQHAQLLIAKWVTRLKQGFHPETRGDEYCDQSGKPSLSIKEQAEYESDIEVAFAIMGEDVFGFTRDCFRAL